MRHNSPTSSESPLFDLQQYVWGRGRNVPEHRKHGTRTHFDPLKKATDFLSLLKTVQSYQPYFLHSQAIQQRLCWFQNAKQPLGLYLEPPENKPVSNRTTTIETTPSLESLTDEPSLVIHWLKSAAKQNPDAKSPLLSQMGEYQSVPFLHRDHYWTIQWKSEPNFQGGL